MQNNRTIATGALLGSAAGDALGTTLEFTAPGSFKPIAHMMGGGQFGLELRNGLTDTSIALGLAATLIRMHGFEPKNKMDRCCRSWRVGYLGRTGTAGHGLLMHLEPLSLAFRTDIKRANP